MARITIKTLAEAVGVSPSTISNAYNKPAQLSAELRQRILAKADELGYAGPDAAGRSLRSGRAGAIGVLFTERLSYAFSDPYAIQFLAGLTEELERQLISVVLLPISMEDAEPEVAAMRQANIDALTTLCVSNSHPAVQLAKTRGIPLVETDLTDDPSATFVAIDDENAGYLVGAHLAAFGHADVTVIVDSHAPAGTDPTVISDASSITTNDCLARLAGLRRGMPDARITMIAAGHNALASGRVAAAMALDSRHRPTALVGLSDVLALGALEAMRARGLSAPGDLSLCGFDDIPAAEGAALTTLRQPIIDKGRQVARLLLDPDLSDRQVTLPIELVVRASTGPAGLRLPG